MAEVTPVQTKDNSTLYSTTGAAAAGAAIGGVGGYLTKPFLKEGKLTDEFIKTAEEKLSDDAKKVLANSSELLADEAETRRFLESLKNESLSDASIMKHIQESAKKRIETIQGLPEKLKGAKTLNEFIDEIAKQDEAFAKLYSRGIIEDSAEELNNFKNIIKQKYGSSLSTDILRQVEETTNPNELATIIKSYDEEIAQNITKTLDPQEILKSMQADTSINADLAEELGHFKRITEAKSFEELKGVVNNLPEDSAARIISHAEGDIEVINMTQVERFNNVKQNILSGIDKNNTSAIEKINASKDTKELSQIVETAFNKEVAKEKHNLISGCWDSTKKEFVNTENALGESVKKAAGGMKTRAAILYAAIGAAILGIGTYLFMNSKKTAEEAPKNVDTKA